MDKSNFKRPVFWATVITAFYVALVAFGMLLGLLLGENSSPERTYYTVKLLVIMDRQGPRVMNYIVVPVKKSEVKQDIVLVEDYAKILHVIDPPAALFSTYEEAAMDAQKRAQTQLDYVRKNRATVVDVVVYSNYTLLGSNTVQKK